MDIVLISPVSPFGPLDGHRLAVLSDVHAILDNRLRLGLITFAHGGENGAILPACPTKVIPALSGGFLSRVMRSMLKRVPPSVERLYTDQAHHDVRQALLYWAPKTVVIDDVPVSGYIALVREILPKAKIVLRSHNVMNDLRLVQMQRSRGLSRLGLKMEHERYVSFERNAVQSCDVHWAITLADALRMKELYHRPADLLTVSVPLENYEFLRTDQGRSNGFVHVGTLDIRRRSDLSSFLNFQWPRVLDADSNATLTLAGALRGGEIPARNVIYSGRVTSDADIYRLGRFAFNFQSSTGGVKLKTLTSLAAGRTLVSTAEGVEGLPLESAKHYWDLDAFLANAQLKQMLEDVRATQPVADAGRSYVVSNHSRSALALQFRRLFEAIQ